MPDEKAGAPVVEIQGVTKIYADGTTALNELSLAVRSREIIALVGANGSGKSTLLQLVAGMIAPSRGEICLWGELAKGPRSSKLRRRIRFITQDPALDPEMTAQETLRLFAALYGCTLSESKEQIAAVVSGLSLETFQQRVVARLSGGQRQRLHLALGVLGRAELFLLDEPASALDASVRHQLWGVLADQKRRGASVILATHHLEEALEHVDRIAVFARGDLKSVLTPEQLRQRYGGDREQLYRKLVGEPLPTAATRPRAGTGRGMRRQAHPS